MKKLIALFLLVQVAAGMRAQFVPTDTLRFRISLKDKAATHYSLSRPEQFLSAKAIIRTTSGREVMRTDLQPNDELVAPVEVSHLAPGVYKLEVVSPAGTYKQTIMKGA